MLFQCEACNDIKSLYIDKEVLTCTNEYNFITMMNADNTDYIVNLHILCHACLKFVNSCMTACTMSALWLHNGHKALCTMNEIKLELELELETNLVMAMTEECTLLCALISKLREIFC